MCADKTETDQGVGPDREGTGVFRFLVRFVWFVLDQIRVTKVVGSIPVPLPVLRLVSVWLVYRFFGFKRAC